MGVQQDCLKGLLHRLREVVWAGLYLAFRSEAFVVHHFLSVLDNHRVRRLVTLIPIFRGVKIQICKGVVTIAEVRHDFGRICPVREHVEQGNQRDEVESGADLLLDAKVVKMQLEELDNNDREEDGKGVSFL